MFINVSTHQSNIRVRGFPYSRLANDLSSMLNSRRFTNQVIKPILLGFEFNQFFLPDLFYAITCLREHVRMIPYKYKLEHLLTELKNSTWLHDIDTQSHQLLDFKLLEELSYPPLDYQLEFLKYYSSRIPALRLKGALLSAAPGTGKTYTTLALAHCLASDMIVVISPLQAINKVWETNIQSVFKAPQSYYLSNTTARYQGQRIAVYHYEALNKAIDDLPLLSNHSKVTVILDESHNLNELKSQRTQLFLELVRELKPQNTVFASGSSLKAVGREVVPLLKTIDPLMDIEAERIFTKIYSVGSAENAEIFKNRLGMVSFKVEKSAIELDRPNLIDIKIKVHDGDLYTLEHIRSMIKEYTAERTKFYAARKSEDRSIYDACLTFHETGISHDRYALHAYEEYQQDVYTIIKAHDRKDLRSVKDEIERANRYENTKILPSLPPEQRKPFKEAKTIVKYVSLKIQGECLGRILGRYRIEANISIASSMNFKSIVEEAELKTIIFSTYTEVCAKALAQCAKQDMKPVTVYGDTTKMLSATVTKFEHDEQANPLITTYASLSTAVPLIMANTVILINPPFRSYIQDQAISRVHRLGAKAPVFVYQCSIDTGEKPNVTTRGIDILKWSQEQVEALTGVENIYKDSTEIAEDAGVTISNESIGIDERYIHAEIVKPLYLEGWGL